MGRREEMLSLRSKLLAEHPHLQTAGDLAPLMGEFERDYWEWQLDSMAEEFEASRPAYVEVQLPPSSVDEGNPDR